MTVADTSANMSPALPEGVPTFDGTQTGGPVLLTPSQAAAVLGKSERTVLRRMDVPAKLPEGWTVTERGGKKLVRVADVRTLPASSAVTVAAGETAVTDRTGEAPPSAALADTFADNFRAENSDLREALARAEAQVEELRTAVAASETREAWLRAQIEQAAAERERILDLVPKALPPAGGGWWSRMFRKGGAGNG